MSEKTTTGGFITSVENVSVPPRRYQSEVNGNKPKPSELPIIHTPESAIKWLEENAVGEVEGFFKYIADLVRDSINQNTKKEE